MKEINLNAKAGKAGVWYTFANMLLKGCLFLTLPVFTRLLSPVDFGIYNTYMAYEGLGTAVLGLGLYGTVKNAKLDYKEQFPQYLSSVLFLSLIFLFLVAALVNVFWDIISFCIDFDRFVTNCLILQSYASFLIFFFGAKLNIEFKYRSYVIISAFNVLGNIALSLFLICFVFPNERYLARILGSAFPLWLIGAFICFSILKNSRVLYRRNYWVYALSIGLPLVPHVVSQSLLSQFDRIMISKMVGDGESGIYSYIYTICTITFVISQSLDNAWTPWVYMKMQDNNLFEIKRVGRKYVLFFAVLSLSFICLMPEITKIIAGGEYWGAVDLLVPLTLANFFVFLYMLPVGIEYYNKKTKFISFGTVSSALLNLGLNYVGIYFWGYKIAAYTTLISYALLFVFHWLIANPLGINRIYDLKYVLKVSFSLLSISFVLLYISFYGHDVFYIMIRYIILLFLLIFLCREGVSFVKIIKK